MLDGKLFESPMALIRVCWMTLCRYTYIYLLWNGTKSYFLKKSVFICQQTHKPNIWKVIIVVVTIVNIIIAASTGSFRNGQVNLITDKIWS